MYQKGDSISYSGHGVCGISDIGAMDFGSGKQDYYIIEPIAAGNATIYLPQDNSKALSRIRPVLTMAALLCLVLHQYPFAVDEIFLSRIISSAASKLLPFRAWRGWLPCGW